MGVNALNTNSITNKILFTDDVISKRVVELGKMITSDYAGESLFVITILHGSIYFVADLTRNINLPLELATINISSYHGGTRPSDFVFSDKVALDQIENIGNKNILLVDDIFDSGKTLMYVYEYLLKIGKPRSIKSCVLLNKKVKRSVDLEVDYWGFEIENEFVVGYGLDYKKQYRNLPYIGVIKNKYLE